MPRLWGPRRLWKSPSRRMIFFQMAYSRLLTIHRLSFSNRFRFGREGPKQNHLLVPLNLFLPCLPPRTVQSQKGDESQVTTRSPISVRTKRNCGRNSFISWSSSRNNMATALFLALPPCCQDGLNDSDINTSSRWMVSCLQWRIAASRSSTALVLYGTAILVSGANAWKSSRNSARSTATATFLPITQRTRTWQLGSNVNVANTDSFGVTPSSLVWPWSESMHLKSSGFAGIAPRIGTDDTPSWRSSHFLKDRTIRELITHAVHDYSNTATLCLASQTLDWLCKAWPNEN